MAFPAYSARVFPAVTGGGPGVQDTVVLTITATGDTSSNPVTSVTTPALYEAADANGKARHSRFSDLVMYFRAYGQPVTIASTGGAITLGYEHVGLHTDGTPGKPAWRDVVGERPNAYELAQAYVAANSHTVTVIAVAVNGVSQTS